MRRLIIIFFGFLFCSLSFHSMGQSKADILKAKLIAAKTDTAKINLLLKIGNEYKNTAPDSALIYYDAALLLAKKNRNLKAVANCLKAIGEGYENQGRSEKAMTFYLQSVKIFETINNKIGMADNYMLIGNIQLQMTNDSLALDYYKKSLVIYEALKDKIGIRKCYINFGNAFLLKGQVEKTVKKNNYISIKLLNILKCH